MSVPAAGSGLTTFRILGCVFLLLAAGGGAAAQITPLQDASCPLPPELKGVRGHALFRYTVGSTGEVGAAEELYVTAQPPSQKEAFSAALKKCLQGWRYKAPGGRQSLALPTQMVMAFHYFEPAPEGAASITLPDGRSLPSVHLEEMRKEKIGLASRLLEGPDDVEIKQGACTVLTNVPAGPRKQLLAAIEAAHRAFDLVFPSAPEVPESSMLNVFLFKDEGSFNEVAAFDNLFRMRGGIAGQYSPLDQTAYASLGSKPPRLVIDTLVHETTHYLVHRRLFQDGRDAPYWVNEGIATFVELVRPGKRLDLRRFERGRQQQGGFRWQAEGDTYLEALSGWTKTGTDPTLEAFLSGSSGALPAEVAYGLSWLMVHFLTTGEDQVYRGRFQIWLQTTADARKGDSLLPALGLTPEEFRRKLLAHRKRLQAAAY